MAFVFTTASKAFEFSGAPCKFKRAFHAYLLTGSGDFALESSPVAVSVGTLVTPIALLVTTTILEITRTPIGDLSSIIERVG